MRACVNMFNTYYILHRRVYIHIQHDVWSIMLKCAHIIFLHSTNIEEIIKYTNQCLGWPGCYFGWPGCYSHGVVSKGLSGTWREAGTCVRWGSKTQVGEGWRAGAGLSSMRQVMSLYPLDTGKQGLAGERSDLPEILYLAIGMTIRALDRLFYFRYHFPLNQLFENTL